MVAAVERPDRDHLQRHADDERRDQREDRAEHEAAGDCGEGRGEIGAEHVERAVRQIDQIHDAEDQRQPGRQQEQQHAELDAVQALFDEVEHGPVPAANSCRSHGPMRHDLAPKSKTAEARASGRRCAPLSPMHCGMLHFSSICRELVLVVLDDVLDGLQR